MEYEWQTQSVKKYQIKLIDYFKQLSKATVYYPDITSPSDACHKQGLLPLLQ